MQNVVRKVYWALTEADDSYGWNQKYVFIYYATIIVNVDMLFTFRAKYYMYMYHSCRETFRSPVNRETTQKLVSDSKVQLPDTPSALIKGMIMVLFVLMHRSILIIVFLNLDAARTYFVSIAGSERLRSTGKYSEKCTQQRRRNRLLRVCM